MPCLSDPAREAARIQAVREALQRDKRWRIALASQTPQARRITGQNAAKHGTRSAAFELSNRYISAIALALKKFEKK